MRLDNALHEFAHAIFNRYWSPTMHKKERVPVRGYEPKAQLLKDYSH